MAAPHHSPPSSPVVAVAPPSYQPPEPALAAADGGGDGGEQGNNAFSPSDQELVWDYLARKVLEQPIPVDFIMDTELCKVDPGELPRNYPYNEEGGSRYFFSLRGTWKYGERRRTSRTTPGGRWRGGGRETEIKDDKGALIGFKRPLRFYSGKKRSEQRMTQWTMEEFRLNTDLEQFKNHNNAEMLVLCKVTEKTIRRRDTEQAEGSGCGVATHGEQEEVDV